MKIEWFKKIKWFKKEVKKEEARVNKTIRDIRVTGIGNNTFKCFYLDKDMVDVYVYPEQIEGRCVATIMSEGDVWLDGIGRTLKHGDMVLLESHCIMGKNPLVKIKEQNWVHISNIFAIITAADLKMPSGPVKEDGKKK